MRFESRPAAYYTEEGQTVESGEHAVFAVDPRQGNDSALLAVFDNPRSPAELAAFLNWAYDKYLRDAPMEPAADTCPHGRSRGWCGDPACIPFNAGLQPATETRISPGGSRHAEQSAYERGFGSKPIGVP
jgi:hypothetical protein